MSKLFQDMNLKEQIAHIRKCQANGLECISNGEEACLADIADHLDIWGPWLCDKVEELATEQEELVKELYQHTRINKFNRVPE